MENKNKDLETTFGTFDLFWPICYVSTTNDNLNCKNERSKPNSYVTQHILTHIMYKLWTGIVITFSMSSTHLNYNLIAFDLVIYLFLFRSPPPYLCAVYIDALSTKSEMHWITFIGWGCVCLCQRHSGSSRILSSFMYTYKIHANVFDAYCTIYTFNPLSMALFFLNQNE